jgi:putative flippase GtrA
VITRRRLHEITRYVMTGGICVCINVFASMLLTEVFGLHYLVSLTLVSLVVTVTGFLLNRSWTFRKTGVGIAPEFLRYSFATAVNIVIGLWACSFLVEQLRIPYAYSIAIVSVVFAPMTYIVHRAWSFGLSWLYGE